MIIIDKKIMKKYIIWFFCIWIFFSQNIAFWEGGVCLIKNQPAPVLEEYIRNLKKVIQNFNTEVSKITPHPGKVQIFQARAWILRSFNTSISWNDYYTLPYFYMGYGVRNEYVPEIWRDYYLLEREQKLLPNYHQMLLKRWYGDETIDPAKVCGWIPECKLQSTKVYDMLGEIIDAHNAMMSYYRLSILGKKWSFGWTLQFVPSNFISEFQLYYNEYTTHNCSNTEENFMYRVKKQTKLITQWQESAANGIEYWQDAIAMLNGTMDDKAYERRQRELLEQELNHQWTSLRASESILNNFDRYNDSGSFTSRNNFISNSFDYINQGVRSQIDAFRDTILSTFNRYEDDTGIPTTEFVTTQEHLWDLKWVDERITRMYQEELPYAQLQDDTNFNLEGRILELHYNLAQTIQALEKTIKIARKVCNDQWRWIWVCE